MDRPPFNIRRLVAERIRKCYSEISRLQIRLSYGESYGGEILEIEAELHELETWLAKSGGL